MSRQADGAKNRAFQDARGPHRNGSLETPWPGGLAAVGRPASAADLWAESAADGSALTTIHHPVSQLDPSSQLESINMSATATAAPPLPLPSDQDASGRTLGEQEIRLLTAAIQSGTLTSTKGAFVKQLETKWAE
ncbi:hypothetical protein I6F37_40455, partial [Bradyrhizobium sp. NBAIM08]|nr:hypothetical protein [Bradyrhizobium sp. NBAIM08]